MDPADVDRVACRLCATAGSWHVRRTRSSQHRLRQIRRRHGPLVPLQLVVQWDSNQLGHVVVWTSPVQAYRLTLAGPCLGLQTAPGVIGLTSRGGEVSAMRDAVIAGGDHCQIMQIERLDARAIRVRRSKPKAG
ncbi:MAG: DUF6491 family protein [Rhodanobacteraceae bacterium]